MLSDPDSAIVKNAVAAASRRSERMGRIIAPIRPVLLLALSLTIPAFYLVLTAANSGLHNLGRILYLLAGLLIALDMLMRWRSTGLADLLQAARGSKRAPQLLKNLMRNWLPEAVLLVGVIMSAMRQDGAWTLAEWLLRLAFCGVIFARLTLLLSGLIAPNRLLQILGIACLLLVLAGGGFFWLEPNVNSFADGMWLAFTTISTVGYGDMVPSIPASRVFAVFIVVLGYALFSIVTASIAALFIGEDEKRLERELHADIRALRLEVAALRRDLQCDQQIRQAPAANSAEFPSSGDTPNS